ncbi:MAG: DUF349 domain-containing protein [Bacteroidia bacterium]|nr:DUF349 domain-containing protein [Bacteroidia bacterium]MCX7764050.1 DUF349 domain-containing protein [Bacteroidia bacterium]MDW8057079.1 DUF349 domain-containing protein [Bacteroidia bacterium]
MVEPQTPEQPDTHVSFPEEHLQRTLEELLSESPEVLKRELEKRRPHLSEITLLTEHLAKRPYRRKYNHLIQAFKRFVNQHMPEWRSNPKEDIPRLEAFQRRFEDAVIQIEEARKAYEQLCRQNAEKARSLLAQLKDIVLAEQLDAAPRVRQIAREWSRLKDELLPSDRKDLARPMKDFLDQFNALYRPYKEIVEGEKNAVLQRRAQIIAEIEKLFPPDGAQTSFEFWQQQRDRLALLQSEWQSLPRFNSRQERELAQKYRQLVIRFREQYNLFRSQAYQRVQKNPILQETFRRKRQILELLRPLVEREYKSLEEWKDANTQVRQYVREWRTLTEKSLAQDDSREVKRLYAPLNQQFSELLDTFNEKSEAFSQEYRRKQIARIIEMGQQIIQDVQKRLKNNNVLEAVKVFRSKISPWNRRAHRFRSESTVEDIRRQLNELSTQLREAHRAYLQKLNEHLEKRIHLLNQLDELSGQAKPEKLSEFIAKLIEYEQAGEVAPSHRERLLNRQRQAIQRFITNAGISEADFQEAWMTAQIARQSPSQIRKSIESLRSQLNKQKQDLKGYENTLALLSRGKGSEPLRKEIESKISDTKAQIARTQEMIKRLQQQLQSASASSAPSS